MGMGLGNEGAHGTPGTGIVAENGRRPGPERATSERKIRVLPGRKTCRHGNFRAPAKGRKDSLGPAERATSRHLSRSPAGAAAG